MPDQFLAPKIEWPRWTWRESGWWLTVFGAVFAAVVFVYPSLSRHPLRWRLFISLLCFVLSSIVILTLEHLSKTLSVASKRLNAYDDLRRTIEDKDQVIEQQRQELTQILEQKDREMSLAQETILDLSQELANRRRFEIDRTIYYNNTLYVVLKKKRDAKLQVGYRVRVIDRRTGSIMGIFEVTELRSEGYRAKSVGYVDPVWLGFVHQNGTGELPAPPDTDAIFMPKEVDDNED